ncbi:T4SS efffector SepA family protein [Bradyrhizobium yuanmingense]|uniref:T4SS efffector SepA family protein n=1 Tax=Bradyrhizobium yuanmingense TaxID=108015 RepID=UPI00351353D2
MPATVVLPDQLVKKMQAVAIPLQDTYVTVIERAIDALIQQTQGSPDEAATAAAAPLSGGVGSYPADTPPSLTFTKPTAITLEGNDLPKNELFWNLLLFRVIALAATKMEERALRQALIVNTRPGKNEGNGFRYIPEAKMSVQGGDANLAWKATLHLAKAAGLSVDVTFRWGNNEDAAYPGQIGRMSYAP